MAENNFISPALFALASVHEDGENWRKIGSGMCYAPTVYTLKNARVSAFTHSTRWIDHCGLRGPKRSTQRMVKRKIRYLTQKIDLRWEHDISVAYRGGAESFFRMGSYFAFPHSLDSLRWSQWLVHQFRGHLRRSTRCEAGFATTKLAVLRKSQHYGATKKKKEEPDPVRYGRQEAYK